MNLCSEWIELLQSLNAGGVRFLVVGGHAVIIHADPRFTGDLDLWVEPTPENASRVWKVLVAFGAPLEDTKQSDFADDRKVYQMGKLPSRVDILMGIGTKKFSEAWNERVPASLGGVPVHVISWADLLENKRAVGRPKDLLDVESLLKYGRGKKKKKKKRRSKK
ncbi:MAG: hypothetical protein HZA51_00430 [Planctomycetes bacterium]|nr:hypothetical protein [Planctomycetota bacterium]